MPNTIFLNKFLKETHPLLESDCEMGVNLVRHAFTIHATYFWGGFRGLVGPTIGRPSGRKEVGYYSYS